MTTLEAIEACTAGASNAIGPKMAPKRGQVKMSYDADLLAIEGNPSTYILLLVGGENVSHVCEAGKLHKAPCMKL